MSRQHLSPEEIDKRLRVAAWLKRAITIDQAKARKLVPLCNKVFLHQWHERISLFEFAQRSDHARPVLVLLKKGQATLYTERRKPIY